MRTHGPFTRTTRWNRRRFFADPPDEVFIAPARRSGAGVRAIVLVGPGVGSMIVKSFGREALPS